LSVLLVLTSFLGETNGLSASDSVDDSLPPAVNRSIDFVADIQPILRSRCYQCHTAGNEEGGLNLGLRARTLEGGTHGPAIQPGNSRDSLMIQLVAGLDESLTMPPEEEPLSREEIGNLRTWIDQGAHWPVSA